MLFWNILIQFGRMEAWMFSGADVQPYGRESFKKNTHRRLFIQFTRNSVQLCKNAENSR